jgi:hypothetical protein
MNDKREEKPSLLRATAQPRKNGFIIRALSLFRLPRRSQAKAGHSTFDIRISSF